MHKTKILKKESYLCGLLGHKGVVQRYETKNLTMDKVVCSRCGEVLDETHSLRDKI